MSANPTHKEGAAAADNVHNPRFSRHFLHGAFGYSAVDCDEINAGFRMAVDGVNNARLVKFGGAFAFVHQVHNALINWHGTKRNGAAAD